MAEAEANTNLAASAPDLLEAIEDLVSSCKVIGAKGIDQEIANAEYLIARAKGEE